ncbi:uncharacterized protein FTOL_00842 [Fusarium torulosum]|uniref:Uncharacterized protein n=1 Tax=Fusarium torulosum TaxID=33205 RepID=A0AAE8SDA4_9HYPO|nr:uncharacterized protein FTOL_00842 [Fusarium torulosum]
MRSLQRDMDAADGLTTEHRATDQQEIQAANGESCSDNGNNHETDDEASVICVGSNPVSPRDQDFKCRDIATVLASCAAAEQHNSKEGSGRLSEIPSQTGHSIQSPSSNTSYHGTKASSGSLRMRQRTASYAGNDEVSNTDTAVERSLQDPVRKYISWLTVRSAEVEEWIDNVHTLEDHLEYERELKTKFLTQQEKHEQKLDTLQAEMHAIEQDEQKNIDIRNSHLPIIQRRGSDCAEEWRAALDRCNKSLQMIEARKRTVDNQISTVKEIFRQELEGYETRIREYAEQIEAYAPELAQGERKKRAIHIMKKLVEMGESGMASWSDRELDYLENWIGELAVRKPIGDSD